MKTRLSKITAGILTFFLLLAATAVQAQREKIDMLDRFQINKDASFITFETTFSGFPAIRGSFSGYQANIFYDPDHEDRTSATIRLDATTISTAHPKRDEVLQGKGFLEASTFPGIWFQSTSVAVKPNGLELTGNLNIRDVVKEAVLHLDKPKVMRGAMGGRDLMVATGKLSINRQDFGLGEGVNMPVVQMLGNKIDIEFSIVGANYTPAYLKSIFVGNDRSGNPNPVGLVYEEVKKNGFNKGQQKFQALTKDSKYRQTNWLSALSNIGWILMVDGHGKEAVKFFEMALKQNPNHMVSLLRFGDALVFAKEYDRALKHYKQEYSLDARVRFTHLPEMIRRLSGDFDLKNMK